MKKNLFLFFLVLVLPFIWGFHLNSYSDNICINYPSNWPKPQYDFEKNPLTDSKIQLGRKLFYDPQLSANNTISCANCHLSYTAFTHVDHPVSHGIYDSIGFRNSPVLINLAWNKYFMWDGAVNHIEVQALAPITDKREMAETMSNVINKLNQSNEYKSLFFEAFSDSSINSQAILKAMAQFQLTLISSNSKYDKVKLGTVEFSAKEENGYRLFKKHCNSCHTEPLFTNGEFENNGIPVDSNFNDLGRYRITLQSKDSLKFKVPTLRNIEYSIPYMHDGRFKSLNAVVNHYTTQIESSPNKSSKISRNISLSANERIDIVAFLLTLSDNDFIFNPDFAYPRK
jgi:cytochrome c peroxidase